MNATSMAPGLGRPRYQGLKWPNQLRMEVSWGSAAHIDVPEGTMLSITNVDGAAHAWITAMAEDERSFSTASLDVPLDQKSPFDAASFDSRAMAAIVNSRDGCLGSTSVFAVFDSTSEPGSVFTTRVTKDTKFLLISPVTRNFISEGGGARFIVDVNLPGGAPPEFLLPDPLGKVCNEWRIGRGTAHAYEVKKGQFVQIIDIEGQQCSDFMAMRASSLDKGVERYIDSTVSRTMARSAYPQPGLHDKFYDQDIHPLLAVRQDTVGRHDTFALACTARGYEDRGFPGHINCSDNISTAYEPYGIVRRAAWPAVNFFFNSWMDAGHGHLASDEAWSRPGDYVVMEALTDLVCVSTACPDDVDPINGWNPTDIQLRIYEEDTSISHSVSWRAQPDDSAKLTRHSAFHPRTSKLTSSYGASRDLWTPTQYDATGVTEEYWACKNTATLQDMSGLRKYDIVGPDAAELLQHCLTRNVEKLAQHRGFYALVCDERGSVMDDGTLFCIEPTTYRWCCGSDNSALHLRETAQRLGLNAHVRSHGHRMVNLALQGPKSREILSKFVYTHPARPALENIKWFGFTVARIGDSTGPMFMLCRSGFTGELGYEIFCDKDDAIEVWDTVAKAGESCGLVPMGGAALEMLRIEAGLMIAGAEFAPGIDAMESGLGFAVDLKKEAFIGKDALARNAEATRRKLVGLTFASKEAPTHGDPIFVGREQVGIVTSGTHSPQLGHAIAMARVAVENASDGCQLEVGKLDGHMKRLPCKVTGLPFLDPKREKARA